MLLIPVSDVPNQTLSVVLDGQYCVISLLWRQVRLYLTLWVGNRLICQGQICQNRANILQSPALDFSGSLHFFDRLGDQAPAFPGLNSRYFLLFVPVGESLPESLEF